MTDKKPPGHIYEESGFRLPLPRREDLDADARKIFDQLNDPKGGSLVGLRGPGGIRLHSPKVSVLSQPVNRYLRYEAGFDPRIRELAILVSAREHDSQFEWAAHEPAARREGLAEEIIDIVKHKKPADGLPPTETVVINFGRQLFREHKVDAELFGQALEIFGQRALVDLVSLMGMYAATAVLLAAFDIQLHPGQEPLLPVG